MIDTMFAFVLRATESGTIGTRSESSDRQHERECEMGAFTGMKDAKRGFASNPLREGKYVVRIDGCEFFESRKGAEFWKNTLTILAVSDGDHKVGEVVNTFFKCGDGTEKQTFQSNLKSFIAGVMAAEDAEIDEASINEILGKDAAGQPCPNPLAGLVTVVTARKRASKSKRDDKGQPFEYTVYGWEPSLLNEEIKDAIGEEAVARFFPNGL